MNGHQLGIADLLERFGFVWHPLEEDDSGPLVEVTDETVEKIKALVGRIYRINAKGDPVDAVTGAFFDGKL